MSEPNLWEVKFLDCCLAAPVCILACTCPAVVQGMTFFRLGKSSCFRCLFAQYCCCIGLSVNRDAIRKSQPKPLDGSCFMECFLYTCFCCCCHAYLATQEYRQARIIGPI
ncbi:hypothetical protein SteCoe_26879 [Stentor coeruleus]|uniref:Uncharacterized protein n=1 Tax=Stentor coeruleus TaxID=5963 RepID=A0A1R2BBR7_9CILI|nr:hypothetical protein SteCoe_26879 [Stentor coeruleus]